jgi:hypothetical protein
LKPDGGLKCLIKDPSIGQFDVSCELTKAVDNSTVDILATTAGKGILILNSQTIKPIDIQSSSSDNKTYQVNLKLEKKLFLIVENGLFDQVQ